MRYWGDIFLGHLLLYKVKGACPDGGWGGRVPLFSPTATLSPPPSLAPPPAAHIAIIWQLILSNINNLDYLCPIECPDDLGNPIPLCPHSVL